MPFEGAESSERVKMQAGKVSLDGAHHVTVPPKIARIIGFAERLQHRVNRVKKDLEDSGLPLDIEDVGSGFNRAVDIARGINCHKTVLFMRGEIDTELLLAMSDRPEHGGHPEVLALADEHPELHQGDVEELGTYLENLPEGEAYSVHVLRSANREGKGTLVPAHSFLFLGTDEVGNKVCFHKKGPTLRMGFEKASLEKVLKPYHGPDYSFLVLPVGEDSDAT